MSELTTDELLELMIEQDEPYCHCGVIHDQDEIGDICKCCGKIAD
jgi:hypothetical protein